MAIDTEKTLEDVSGGTPYANGSFVDHGNYIVYTVASGDTLIGIASRFGVNFMQIAQWNKFIPHKTVSQRMRDGLLCCRFLNIPRSSISTDRHQRVQATTASRYIPDPGSTPLRLFSESEIHW